jgi:hypothetical protein
LIRALLTFTVFVQLAMPPGGADAGLFTLSWPSAEPSVSTENSSGPIAVSSTFTCMAARPQVPQPTARLVAAYGFEEIRENKTPNDSGESHPATLVNAVLTTGKFGKGIVLNGTNAYIRIDEPSWPGRDYTYAAWVFPRTVSGWRALLGIQTPTSSGVEFAITPGGLIETWSSGRRRLRNGIRLPALAWTHVALTRAGSLITVFLNGIAQRAGRDSTVFDFGNCPALIGVDADFGCTDRLNGFFSGVIDELRVYDCALSASEIRSIMDVPVDQRSHGSAKPFGSKP